MKILVVEDDSFKFSKIAGLLNESFHDEDIIHHDNVFAAVNYIRRESPDIIVLDMSLPSHPAVAGEGSPVSMPTGGIEIILELKILGKRDIPIIILTQYPDVEVEYEYYSISDSERVIKNLYGIEQLSVVHYDNESDNWRYQTKRFLNSK